MSHKRKFQLKASFSNIKNKDVCDPFNNYNNPDLSLLRFTLCQVLMLTSLQTLWL